VKRPSSWSDTLFCHFPWRKSAKGVPKWWKINLHQIYFSNPRMIWYRKGPPVLFWDEMRLWLGRGGLLCGNSVPKFWTGFLSRPVGWSFWPQTSLII
jgi:hypothetical protein